MESVAQLARLGLFDARVPRYTSYPTAPHFKPEVGPETFASWLAKVAPGSAVSLYLHVPFCRRLCWFCACRTQGTATAEPVGTYVETLKAELALLAEHLPQGVRLERLHWGGGTPTLMTPAQIGDLAGAIAARLPFAPGAEFSVEIDPTEIDAARIDALTAAGMNRASIGVQDFDPLIQRVIGRAQSFDVTREAVRMLRAAGIGSLNADILYGLPHQTRARMADSVQKLLDLSPDRVALYGYAHVPWMARRQGMIPTDSLPRPEERLELFETARRLFVWDGYAEIGIDHFARPHDGLARAAREGRLRRNFQGYTDDAAGVLIGVGASAISRLPQGYAQNAAATSAYTAAIRSGRFATQRGHAFRGDDLMRARMIEALLCDFRIDAAEIRARFGIGELELLRLFRAAGKPFEGWVEIGPAGFAIPPRARPLARMIARAFDAYELSKAGHSPAI
jgi:oxygen-independent coproporphyrinogen-3 oxidase